jgi:hypothetical protein
MPTFRVSLLLSLAAWTAYQDAGSGSKPPPAPPPFPGKEAPSKPTGPEARSAASDLKPGELPAAATPEARSAWERVRAASLVPGADHAPVSAFELSIDVRYYRSGTRGSNDFAGVVYRFLAPTFVRVKTVEGNREVLRGPEGDWLHDGARNQTVNLSVGREFAEDRRQLDEWTGVARNFVSLTDPRSLRIAGLELLKSAPPCIPAPLSKRAGEVAWLRVRSPDFRLVGANPGSGLFRASLGYDPKTSWVEIALVEEDLPEGNLRPSAKLIEMGQPAPSQGFFVPKKILVYSIEEGRLPPAFAVPAGMDLVVRSSNLRAALKPDDFKH